MDTKAQYEHYFRKDIDVTIYLIQIDINQADRARRHDIGNTRFGGDSRVNIVLFSSQWHKKNTK